MSRAQRRPPPTEAAAWAQQLQLIIFPDVSFYWLQLLSGQWEEKTPETFHRSSSSSSLFCPPLNISNFISPIQPTQLRLLKKIKKIKDHYRQSLITPTGTPAPAVRCGEAADSKWHLGLGRIHLENVLVLLRSCATSSSSRSRLAGARFNGFRDGKDVGNVLLSPHRSHAVILTRLSFVFQGVLKVENANEVKVRLILWLIASYLSSCCFSVVWKESRKNQHLPKCTKKTRGARPR